MWWILPLAPNFGAPLPIIIGITLVVVGLLFLRFLFKTAITLVKIGVLVAIGVAAYVGITYLLDAIG